MTMISYSRGLLFFNFLYLVGKGSGRVSEALRYVLISKKEVIRRRDQGVSACKQCLGETSIM
jgi:hypothetical protein